MDRINLDQPLVYAGVEFEKESSVEMPLDEGQWILSITKEIHEQVPALEGQKYQIDMKKTHSDKGTGYGYGSIVGENFTIPIIIKNGLLMDLDIFIDSDGQAWPTAHGYFDQYIMQSNTNKYGKIVKPKVPAALNMSNRMSAPDSENRGYVSETPVFSHDKSMIGKLEKSDEEIEKIAQKLKGDPNIVASYKHNGTEDVLKVALASVSPPEGSPVDSRDDAFIVDSDKAAEKVAANGKYIVRSSDGNFYKCSIVKDVVGFDLKPKDYLIASNFRDKTKDYLDHYAIQADIAGFKVGEIGCTGDVLSYGDTDDKFGCFVIEKEGKILLIEPVRIISCVNFKTEKKVTIRDDNEYDNKTEINTEIRTKEYLVQDMMGRQFKVFSSAKFNGVTERDGNYYLNRKITFKSLRGAKVTLASSPAALTELAKKQREAMPITIKVAGSIVSSDAPWASDELRGGAFIRNAKKELCDHYTDESIDSVLKTASDKGVVQINRPSIKSKEIQVYENVPSFDTIKIAAAFDDAETVDKILSLNFLKPANVEKFMEYVPDLKACLNKLSDLLLASRIGLAVPPIAVKTAVDSMAETIMYLESIDKSDKKEYKEK